MYNYCFGIKDIEETVTCVLIYNFQEIRECLFLEKLIFENIFVYYFESCTIICIHKFMYKINLDFC